MERIVLRHLTGSKANQVDEYPLNHIKELSIGRDPSSLVKYDPDRDDLVGRQHATISQNTSDPTQFTISDLNSRNGTYVNKQRILGSTKILPGDVVQLGPGGPEFQFDIEPRPANMVRPTRVGDAVTPPLGAVGVPPTRFGTPPAGIPQTAPAGAIETRVGKATVERMVAQSKSDSKKYVVLALVAFMLIVVVVAGGLFAYFRIQANKTASDSAQQLNSIKGTVSDLNSKAPVMTPSDIASNYSDSTVFVQVNWSLADSSGSPLFFYYVRNVYTDPQGIVRPIVPDNRRYVAAYKAIQGNNGVVIEPFLTTDSQEGSLPSVGFPLTGSGFCVTNDGFIMTNLHVAANWKVAYHNFQSYAFPGVVFNASGKPIFAQDGSPQLVMSQSQVNNWIPSNTKQFGDESELGHAAVQGRADNLDVTFANTELRRPAKTVAISDRHDVALIKIDIPEVLKKVDLNDNYDAVKNGEPVTVLGYPGGSPQLVGVIGTKGQRGFYEPFQLGIIPQPTLSTGNISQILREQEGGNGKDTVVSVVGDQYQLTINSTGGGNSGGPVFDDHGRVIAIFTYGLHSDFNASAAVPIKFGMELMGIKKVR
jgi:serine protease Do